LQLHHFSNVKDARLPKHGCSKKANKKGSAARPHAKR